MSAPLVYEDTDGRVYIEAAWIIDSLIDMDADVRSSEKMIVEQIMELVREIEKHT